MMRSSLTLFAVLCISLKSFSQFKNTYASNGNPTSQIIDASGMKQGVWQYFDAQDHLYRTELFNENVIVKHDYIANGNSIDMLSYSIMEFSAANQNLRDFIIKKLQPYGNGELIFFEDGTVRLHFYLGKLKAKTVPSVDLSPVKKFGVVKSIIKF